MGGADDGTSAPHQPAGDRAAQGKDGGGHQQQPRDQVEKGHLRRVEQDHGAGGAAEQACQAHGQGEARVLADVVAIGGDGGELAGPQGYRVGGVGLNGKHLHAQHGGKEQEAAATGHSVQHSGQKGSHREPKPVPVHQKDEAGKRRHVLSIVAGSCRFSVFDGELPVSARLLCLQVVQIQSSGEFFRI